MTKQCMVAMLFMFSLLTAAAAWAEGEPAVLLWDIQNRHAETEMAGIEERASVLLAEALHTLGLFRVMDRQFAGAAEGADPLSPTVLSKLSEVDFLVTGTLSGDDLATEITLKFIAPKTGQVVKTLKAANITTPHIEPIIRKLYRRIKAAFPLCGQVIQVHGEKVYLDVGSAQGVKVDDRFRLSELIEIKAGATVIDHEEVPVGTLVIKKVMANAAWGLYRPGPDGGGARIGLTAKSLVAEQRRPDDAPPTREIIALKPFDNLSGEPRNDYIGAGIADSLLTSLSSLKTFRLVERAQIEKLFAEQRLGSSWIFDQQTTVESGRLWSPRFVISGSFQRMGEFYRIDGRMLDLESSEVIAAESIIGKDLFQLTRELGDILLRNLEGKKALKDSRLKGLRVATRSAAQIPMSAYHLLPELGVHIQEVAINNGTGRTQRLTVQAELTGISHKVRQTVEIEAGQELTINPQPDLLPGLLKQITSARRASWTIEVLLADGRSVYEQSSPVELLPYDALVYHQQFIDQKKDLLPTVAAWISPNLPEGAKILSAAAERTASRTLTGYQTSGFLTGAADQATGEQRTAWTREQVGALYDTLKGYGIRYVDQSTQFPAAALQRVLLPAEALKHKSANCIDGAVLFSSLMLRAGLNPIIIIVPGHAFVGWETWQGSRQYEVLETTQLGYAAFDSALAEGHSRAKDAHIADSLTRLRFRRDGMKRIGQATILDVRTLKKKIGDLPI